MTRVLIIDKTAGLESSHERHRAIANQPGIELHVLGPRFWIENGREIIWEPPDSLPYQAHFGKVFFKDYYARAGYYSGLWRAIVKAQPDIIQLLEEPWSITALQTVYTAAILAPSACILFYTWENFYRPWTYPSRARPLYRLIDKTLYTLSSGAVCATHGAKDVLLRKGYDQPILVNPYGIPSFFFNRNTISPSDARPFTFGYVGRLMFMKGTDLLLDALAAIPDARLILIGGGEDAEQYRVNAHRMGIDDRVEWITAITEHRVPDALKRMDAFVLPSRHTYGWKEQLGRVAIEAMAVGTPVVGSHSGAIPEVIDDAGLLFDENSIDDLVRQLLYLKNNPERRLELGQAGMERAYNHFTWPRFAAQLCEFYQRLS